MRLSCHALLGLAASLALTVPLAAQQRLETASGRVYEGKILSDDGAMVEIETTEGLTMKLPYAQLTPMTRYRLKRDTMDGEDGKAQLELAEWCVDATLYKEAKRHYRLAMEKNPLLGDEITASLTAARTQAANELLERAKGLLKSNQPGEARRILGSIVQELPLEEAATEATRLLAQEIEDRKASDLTRRRTADKAAGDAAEVSATGADGAHFSEQAVKTMGRVIDAYKEILDHTHAGLSAKSDGTSIKEFEKGLHEGDRAIAAVDKVRGDAATDDELAEAVELADEKLEEAIVDLRLFLVDAYLLRTSYSQASDVVKQGLASYPKNERLRDASARVVAAANDNDIGGWRIRRGR